MHVGERFGDGSWDKGHDWPSGQVPLERNCLQIAVLSGSWTCGHRLRLQTPVDVSMYYKARGQTWGDLGL
jgi:hypothetical protein